MRDQIKALYVILAVFLSAGCAGKDPGTAVRSFDLTPRFHQGDHYTLHLVSTRTTTQPGKPPSSMTTHADILLAALETTPNGSVVQWTRGETIIDDASSRPVDPVVKTLLNVIKGLRMDILIDARGNGLDIRNWEEVRAKGEPLIDAIIRSTGLTDNPDVPLERMRQTLSRMFITEQRFLEEASLYFLPFGRSYSTGKPTACTVVSSNPFGGEPLRTASSISLQSFDTAAPRAVLKWEQSFDRDTIRLFSKSMVYALMPETIDGRKATSDDLLNISIKDEATFIVNPITGLVESASHTHTYQAGELMQVDTRTFTLSAA